MLRSVVKYIFCLAVFCDCTALLAGTTPFVTTWYTDGYVFIDTPVNVDFRVDWGDGNITNHTEAANHEYETAGVYTVSITGYFPSCKLGFLGDTKLLSVEQWGNNQWVSMKEMFAGTDDWEKNYTDTPDLSSVTDISGMFSFATISALKTANWDFGNIKNMSEMFFFAKVSDMDMNHWDTSKVLNMSGLFRAASVGQGVAIANWDVGQVTDMSAMFSEVVFEEPFNIGGWDVGQVTNMSNMFFLSDFNDDISNWDVRNVVNMSDTFSHARYFNQDISNWQVGRVTNMASMFYFASVFNQDIGRWDVSQVTNMRGMFVGLKDFDQDLGNWQVGNVLDFTNFLSLVNLSLANYDALWLGWSKLDLQANVSFSGGTNQYCLGEAARASIIEKFSWEVNDGGPRNPMDILAAQTALGSYTLPQINGNLSGLAQYYTGPNGSGTAFNIGEVLFFEDFKEYPVTLYVHAPNCELSQQFKLTIKPIPSCVRPNHPAPGAQNLSIAPAISWDPVLHANGYKIAIGSDPHLEDIVALTDVGDDLSFTPEELLPENSRIYIRIIPYNNNGDAPNCEVFYFDTEAVIRTRIPRFFTPNNDNRNDFWVVQDPDRELSSVYIFDRFGKLITAVNNITQGWDGNNAEGVPLPVNDYWYMLVYNTGKVEKGHFSLMR